MAFSECMNFICLQVPSTVSHVCNSNSFVHFILDNVDPSILGPKVPITKFIMDKKKFQASRDIDTKFIFVREPIERLASCYNDKMIVNTVGVLQTRLSLSPSPGYNALHGIPTYSKYHKNSNKFSTFASVGQIEP